MTDMNSEKNIFLSIIIPVYNSAAYLSKCVDSILEAELPDIEIILIDDGSTDGSVSLCHKYSEKYSFVQTHTQNNMGPSAARNSGLQYAAGKFIAFFDSDDYVSPTLFRTAVSRLDENNADLWVFDFQRVAENGCVLDRVYQVGQTDKPINDKSFLNDFLKTRDCFGNVWRYIYGRRFIEEHNLRFIEGIDCAEDLEFSVRALISAENISFFHVPYYFYRVNYGNSLSRRKTAEHAKHLMQMLCLSHDYLHKINTVTAKLIDIKISREYFLNLSMYYEASKNDRKLILKYIKEAQYLLRESPSLMYRMIGREASVFGIRHLALFLLMLKRLKRSMRKIKSGTNPAEKRR